METAGQVRRALQRLKNDGMKGLILDLRFNPGGLLTSAVEISDLFVDDGVIVTVKNRYDAMNLFRLNANVLPTAAVPG